MNIEDIALTMTPGIGVKSAVYLLEVFGSAQAIFAATEAELTGKAQLRADVARNIMTRTAFGAAEREVAHCKRHGIRAVASTDPEYPRLLRDVPDYPHVLYVQGDPAILSARCVAMVGTRKPTPYGQQMCVELVQGLAELVPELCVVSGLAFGVDVVCHRAAMAAGVKTVAVLPNSLPGVTPTQHASVAREILDAGGALVSELHSQVRQRGTFYLARNRIIAALGAGTVVVESPCGGGSLVTAHCADSYNRSVMAVPGRATDKVSLGTNLLIRNRKAQLVLSGRDIAQELMWDLELPVQKPAPQSHLLELTDDEERIVACFGSSDPVSVETLSVRCSLAHPELSVLLLGLEMTGTLRQLPGNMYMKLV